MRLLWWIAMLAGVFFMCACGPVGTPSTPMPSGPGNPNGFGPDPDSYIFSADTSDPWSVPDAQSSDGNTVSQWDDPDEVCGYGTVYGIVCSKSLQMFVNDATVTVDTVDCDGTPLHIEVHSDAEGYYTLEGVPSGMQTIRVDKELFHTEYAILIKDGKLSDVTGVGHKECFQAFGCTETVTSIPVESKVVAGMADVVWFIDTSGSMKQEAAWLQQNVNAFAQHIANQNVSYRVILIAKGFDICVPPPLGGPNCTDGPNFRHIKDKVGSTNGLQKLVDLYPLYQDFLRKGAMTNFVAVTDDDSKKTATWFDQSIKAFGNPGISDPYLFHSIVAYGDIPFVGCWGGADIGTQYLLLTSQTAGAHFPICETDWGTIFGQLAETVVNTVQPVCMYALPMPDKIPALDKIQVTYANNGVTMSVPMVSGPEACIGTTQGWYVDNVDNPTSILFCTATCSEFQTGLLTFEYSC